MVVSSAANRDSFKVTTPSDCEIRLTRLFDAPPHLVFEAMTKPEHVKQWWGRLGEGYSVPVCEIDLRPGDHPAEPARLHRDFRAISGSVSVVTAEFTDEAGKTRLTATVRYPSLEVRNMVLASGMASGASASYDRLEDLVVALQRS